MDRPLRTPDDVGSLALLPVVGRDALLRAIVTAGETAGGATVVYLDVDRFHQVNTRYGHDVGDQLLAVLARRLAGAVLPPASLAAIDGDGFAVVLPGSSTAPARRVAERLLELVATPVSLDGRVIAVRASAGLATRSAPVGADLLEEAFLACRRAKATNGGSLVEESSLAETTRQRSQVENELARAIEQGELRLRYQPKVDLADGVVVGAEALVRWQHPERGLVGPGAFIDVAEETGLIVPLGQWVLAEALRQAEQWPLTLAGVPMRTWVNLSAVQLDAVGDLRTMVLRAVQDGLDPRSIGFEVTESSLLADLTAAVTALSSLRALGAELALDDFGTGYSSLSYLRRLPVSSVKIDRSFVSGMDGSLADAAIVEAVVELSHALGMQVVAEGVEERHQVEELQRLGVDEAQGFYFAQPLPGDQMLRLVRQPWCGVPVPSAARTRDHRADALPGFGGPRSRLLLAALDASADSVMVTTVGDPSAGLAPHVSYVNAAFERETGYPAADVLGRPWWFSLPNDAAGRAARAALEEALSTGSATTMTVVNQRADGGLFQCELTVSPITDERGFLTHWMHLRRDLTARRAVEADRDRFQRAIDQTQLAIVFMRPDTTLIYANAAARAMSGLGPEESLEGLHISDLTAPDLVDELRARMLPALARDQRWEGPTVFRHRLTGEQIPLWNDVQVVADPDNPEGSYLAAIAQDRRPELAAAEALEATARRAEHLLSSTGDGVVVLDEMGRLTYANQAAQQLVGLRVEELIGLSAFDLVAAKHVGVALDAFTRQLDRPSDGGDPDLMEVELTTATGRQVPVELVAVRRFDDPAVAGLVVSMRDVTERVERRRELAAMARLERLMTLAAQTATDNTLEEYLAQLAGVLDDFAEALGCDAVYVDRLEGAHVISLSVSTRSGKCFPDSPIPRERLVHWLEALEALGRLVVEDSEAEPAVWMDEQHEVFGRVPRAVLAMPLRSAGQSIAVLGAYVVESARRWQRVEIEAFERFGRIVANVLDRYRLSAELTQTRAGLLLNDGTGRTAAAAAERRLSHLGLTYAVSRLALHLPSEEFASRLDDVAADIARLIGVPAVAIDVLDSAAGPLRRLGRWPVTVDAEPSEREQGWLSDLQRLRPVEHDGAEWLASRSYARALAVPMLAAGRLFGALVVADDGEGAWESDERTVLQVVAETIAAALERRQLDSALRASEARFRLLSEEAGDVVGLAAMDGRVMYISPSVTDVLGYAIDEVLGKTVPEFLLSDDLSQLQIHVGDVLHGVRDTFEMRVRKADGTMTWTAVNARAVVDADTGRATEVRFSLRDITDLKRLEAELKRQALHDPLTGLANRALLQTRLQVAAARRSRPNDLALLLIDLDGFKYINDSFGHAVGDEVLRTVAERLADEGRAGDTLARMGGDEFVLLCPETTLDGAASVAERVVETISRPIVIDGVTHVVGASVGVAHADGKLPEPDWLLLEADRAMYLAKAAGKGRVRLATTRMPTLD